MLKPFRLLEPTTVEDAASELGRLGEQGKVYAGGAELVLLMRAGVVSPDYLVNVKRIPRLSGISWDGEALHIGATVTHRKLETDATVREHLPLLATCEAKVGNIRVRCQGTLGGNLVFADPHADPGTALLVYDTRVTVAGRGGARTMPLDDFLVGTYEVALEPDELLTDIHVMPLPDAWRTAYQRFEQFHRPTLNAAAAAVWQDGALRDVRLAVGCAGPRPLRLPELEAQIRGATPGEARAAIAASKPYLSERLEPVDDLLGSADYKAHLASVLVGRALEDTAHLDGRNGHVHA